MGQPAETWDWLRAALDEGYRSIDQRLLKEYGPLQPDRFELKEANERLGQSQACAGFRP